MAKEVTEKDVEKAEKKLAATMKKLTTAEKKLEETKKKQAELKVKKGVEYNREGSEMWGFKVKARTIGTLSGSKAEDIIALIGKPETDAKTIENKLLSKEAEMVIKKTNPLPEEIEAIRAELSNQTELRIGYSAPKNVFHRDRQVLGEDKKPVPCLGAHMVFGAFRTAASNSFPREFMIYTQLTNHKGWPSNKHMRKYVTLAEKHILLYKDPEMKKMICDSDIIVEGQNPVGDVKGFAQYETIIAPAYFQFTMFFNPKGMFPSLANKQLVIDCFEQSVYYGLGSRRGVNYGQWEVVNMEMVGMPGEKLFDKFFSEERRAS